MDEKSFINQPISGLGLSNDFLKTSEKMAFGTIAEILKVDPVDLLKRDGFNYNWLGELIEFLTKHQLLHILQPIPGKSYG
jgi:hypothetical protein